MSAAQIARRAAQIMSERGHCKNRVEDDEGRVCIIGALHMAAREMDYSYMPVVAAAERILLERGVDTGNTTTVIHYNNDPHTTGEDVILLLKEAGHRLEEGENG